MRIAIVYDCLYPYTIGGAERWYASLAERLSARHEVTYVTRRQWGRADRPAGPGGAQVVVVSGGRRLYTAGGRRAILSPLRFGWGVFWHLRRRRRDYDVVHTCGFPYFSLVAARAACAWGGPAVVTDWIEIWSPQYWREYLGRLRGGIGAVVQQLCIRLTERAFVLSQLQARRLLKEGYRGQPVVLSGIYAGPSVTTNGGLPVDDPLVVYVGRHIREKRARVIPAAVALARDRIPQLRATIFGDGPDHRRVLAEIERLGLADRICCPGFVAWEEIDTTLQRATCLLLPSQREGYGLVVVEAAARGVPSIVVRAPDNAAIELIVPGENGLVVDSAEPGVLAEAIAAVHAAGPALRQRTRAWYEQNAGRLAIDAALAQVEAVYAQVTAPAAGRQPV
ncbi:MAG: glycosyltransferase family 4 protein [Deltaproteobacteria bacterium]|nr:glycosyltransferase family 4 protein [Deltaproteobacteria bacterium]